MQRLVLLYSALYCMCSAQFLPRQTGIHLNIPKYYENNDTWVVPLLFSARLVVPIYTSATSNLACSEIDSLCCLYDISGVTSSALTNLRAAIGACDSNLRYRATDESLRSVTTQSIAEQSTFFAPPDEMFLQISNDDLTALTYYVEDGGLSRRVLTASFMFIDPNPSPFALFHQLQETILFYDSTRNEGGNSRTVSFSSTCPNSKPAHALWFPDKLPDGNCSFFCRTGFLLCRSECTPKPKYGAEITFQSNGTCPTQCEFQFNGSHYTFFSTDYDTPLPEQILQMKKGLDSTAYNQTCVPLTVHGRLFLPPPPAPTLPVTDLIVVSCWAFVLLALVSVYCYMFFQSLPTSVQDEIEYRELLLPTEKQRLKQTQ